MEKWHYSDNKQNKADLEIKEYEIAGGEIYEDMVWENWFLCRKAFT